MGTNTRRLARLSAVLILGSTAPAGCLAGQGETDETGAAQQQPAYDFPTPAFGTWAPTGVSGFVGRNVTDDAITRFALARCYVRIETASGRVLQAPYVLEHHYEFMNPDQAVRLVTMGGRLWRSPGAEPEVPIESTILHIWFDMYLFPNTMLVIQGPSGPIFAERPRSSLSLTLWSTGEVPPGCTDVNLPLDGSVLGCVCGTHPDGTCVPCEDAPIE